MPTKVQKERLLKLADVLDNFKAEAKNLLIPVKKFDIESWVTGSRYTKSCGTSACAAGTAAMHPWFIRRGFRLDGLRLSPVYDGLYDDLACKRFFGTSKPFFGDYYYVQYGIKGSISPKRVAKELRKFANGEAW